MRIHHELLICTQVKQPAGGIIWTRGKGISIREKLYDQKIYWIQWGMDLNTECSNVQYNLDTYTDRINVRKMAGEGLSAHAVSNIPQLGGGITGTWYEGLGVWAEWQTHHITCVACEVGGLLACFDIPQCTRAQEFSINYAYTKVYTLNRSKKKDPARDVISLFTIVERC